MSCAGWVLAASEETIKLETKAGTLAGTLALPRAAKPPVVLLVAGSGPTDRDGNSPFAKNDGLKLLSAALNDAGFATVRYDKRGIGESARAATSEAELRIDHYMDDAAAWVEMLARDARFSGVAVIGHSEGSLIGMVAARNGPAKAFVSLAGAGDAAQTMLRRQIKGRLPPDLEKANERIVSALESGRTDADVPPALSSLYRPTVQPYLISWFKYDPAKEIAKLAIACLVVQGDTDIQVGTSDADALQAGNPRCEKRVIAGMNHVLKSVPADPSKQAASYRDPSLPLADDLAETVIAFLSASMRGK